MAITNTGAGLGLGSVQDAYDKYFEFALRPEVLLRAVADKRLVQPTSASNTFTFQRYVDLAQAKTPLTETSDVTAVQVADTTKVSVTLEEYGNAVQSTERLKLESLTAIDPALGELVAYNCRDTIDSLVADVLVAGTQKYVNNGGTFSTSGARASVAATDTITSDAVRFTVAKLRGASAVPRKGSLYAAMIHPDVSHDLRREISSTSNGGGWRNPSSTQAAFALAA